MMSDKIGRNKDWCKAYAARNQDKKNAKRKHITIANRLEKKANKLSLRGFDIDPIGRAIQHHKSLAGR